MSCEQYEGTLSEFVDGTLQASAEPAAAARRDAVEAHLAACPRCRALVADLRAVHRAARDLEARVPPPHVWARIAGQVGTPGGQHRMDGRLATAADRGGAPAIGRRPWGRLTSTFAARDLAIAASLLFALGAGTWFVWQQVPPTSPAPAATTAPGAGSEPDPALVQDVATQLRLAEEHYVKAIAGLEAIASAEGSTLDQETADVLQANLSVIDGAIGESRAALEAEPASTLAQQSLFAALRSKVTLLQDTIALINEMRKGNEEGAARIVNGLNP
jgi:hypothetical protein